MPWLRMAPLQQVSTQPCSVHSTFLHFVQSSLFQCFLTSVDPVVERKLNRYRESIKNEKIELFNLAAIKALWVIFLLHFSNAFFLISPFNFTHNRWYRIYFQELLMSNTARDWLGTFCIFCWSLDIACASSMMLSGIWARIYLLKMHFH